MKSPGKLTALFGVVTAGIGAAKNVMHYIASRSEMSFVDSEGPLIGMGICLTGVFLYSAGASLYKREQKIISDLDNVIPLHPQEPETPAA